MHTYLVEMLECPSCHGALTWTITNGDGDRIESGEARCDECGTVYPIREGIGIFLTPDLTRNDLWEEAESGLARYLRQNPEVERGLMEGPSGDLNPADRLFRSMVLEERGDYEAARTLSRAATRDLYTSDYLACSRSQLDHVIERLSNYQGPIVDLASGRGTLVEEMARRLDNEIVMTDFSPTVLRRNRQMLAHLGLLELLERVSLLAFDARRTPFRDGAIERMTSYLGLPSVEQPGDLLFELRRAVSGELLAVTHFFPEDDVTHRDILHEHELLSRESGVERFRTAGWDMTIENSCRGEARPTPTGVVLDGFGIDGLPIADVVLEWCVVRARPA